MTKTIDRFAHEQNRLLSAAHEELGAWAAGCCGATTADHVRLVRKTAEQNGGSAFFADHIAGIIDASGLTAAEFAEYPLAIASDDTEHSFSCVDQAEPE